MESRVDLFARIRRDARVEGLSVVDGAGSGQALRQRYVSHPKIDNELQRIDNEKDRYDKELRRRADEAYERENPNPPARVHREHGRYLPNDD